MKKLTKMDANKYLKSGVLTQPFLDDNFVLDKVMNDYNFKLSQGKEANKIKSLMNWINCNVTCEKDAEFNKNNKFRRTAEEIWKSKKVTGCTDCALLFCTFARQLGIPTTILHTAEQNWLNDLKNNIHNKMYYGHSFCECYFEDKWILVDPTCRKIVLEYNPNKLVLPYAVFGDSGNTFVPYLRGLDYGKKTTIGEHNREMDKLCKNL